MSALEIGTRLVALCNSGKSTEAVETLYGDKIVSIEGQGSEETPARTEGLEAVRAKGTWWFDNHTVHSEKAVGPFCGFRDDQFVVHFELDITNKPSKQRTRMTEVGIYTVANGKVIQEEFLYLMA